MKEYDMSGSLDDLSFGVYPPVVNISTAANQQICKSAIQRRATWSVANIDPTNGTTIRSLGRIIRSDLKRSGIGIAPLIGKTSEAFGEYSRRIYQLLGL
jgi:hypothetical protein